MRGIFAIYSTGEIFMFFKSKNEELEIDTERIPQHIAIIMDGNGRCGYP